MTSLHYASGGTLIFSSVETYGSEYFISIFCLPEGDIKIKHPGMAITK